MDLKPAEVDRLQTREYWDGRYVDGHTFDWFKTFADLEPFFRQHVEFGKPLKALMLGCGNSTLSGDLHGAGLVDIANVDFSPSCIAYMADRHRHQPELTWHVMDVRALAFDSASFDVAIDKGTLDALLSYSGSVWDIPEDVKRSAGAYMDEVHRVLKPGGRLLYISYRQPHFARLVIDRPYWTMTVTKISDPGSFDYYGYVLEKHN